MFVHAPDAQLIECKRWVGRPTARVAAPGRWIRSWLQNINHQTINAPWVTRRSVTPGAKAHPGISGGLVCEADAQIIAVACEAADYGTD
jgi:hypothetical protein